MELAALPCRFNIISGGCQVGSEICDRGASDQGVFLDGEACWVRCCCSPPLQQAATTAGGAVCALRRAAGEPERAYPKVHVIRWRAGQGRAGGLRSLASYRRATRQPPLLGRLRLRLLLVDTNLRGPVIRNRDLVWSGPAFQHACPLLAPPPPSAFPVQFSSPRNDRNCPSPATAQSRQTHP